MAPIPMRAAVAMKAQLMDALAPELLMVVPLGVEVVLVEVEATASFIPPREQ